MGPCSKKGMFVKFQAVEGVYGHRKITLIGTLTERAT